MSQSFSEDGRVTPVTVIAAAPIKVARIKTVAQDNYSAVQFSYQRGRGLNKIGRKEFRPSSETDLNQFSANQIFDAATFSPGDRVAISGLSKGKGFQGVVKRHGFSGGPRTHGQKHSEREPGSIGGGLRTRVPKGMRMAGRMGGQRVTVKNLSVVEVNVARQQLMVSGAVPGRRGTWLEIRG